MAKGERKVTWWEFAAFAAPAAPLTAMTLPSVIFLPPHFAVLSRRLHDVNMSGWFALLSLIPYLGGLFVLVIALIPSQEAVNRYGAYPKPRAPYPV